MTKVTYLFGAGASANALPVVNELPQRINELVDNWIKGENRNINLLLPDNERFTDLDKSKRDYQNQLLQDMKWVAEEARKHASVDTLAKKLFLKKFMVSNKENEKLNRLKIALAMFFVFEQTRVPTDTRYDAFFASILNVDNNDPRKIQVNLPEKIRIISWNYDYQFERVFSDYIGEHNLKKIQELLNVVSKYSEVRPKPGFSIVKLNGTTTFSGKGKLKDLEPLSNVTVQLNSDTVSALTNYYALAWDSPQNYYPNLSFAWEGEGTRGEPTIPVVEKAIECSQDTDILVVIGYSFPFFNRKIDREIIKNMKGLKRAYFQAPAPHHEKIRTRFQAIRQDIAPENLIAYDEVESFLLPDELEL